MLNFYAVVGFITLFGLVSCNAQSSDGCDDLVPEYCMLPFPSDFWRVRLDNGEYRLNFTEDTFPVDDNGQHIDPVRGQWNELHGFPVLPAITAYFPRLDESSIADAAHWWNIEASLDVSSSPTILLDSVTMQPVAHWVELDHSSNKTEITGKRALLIYPATALEFDRRYIVAIKPLRNRDGQKVNQSAAFAGLLEAHARVKSAPISPRSTHFSKNIFAPLSKLTGMSDDSMLSNLLLAWDFTTNTKSDVTGRMVAARDDARSRLLETDGPLYRIHSAELDTSDLVGKRIKGEFRMPTYLTTHMPVPSARLVLDPSTNVPVFQTYEWYEFEVIVPKAFVDSPGSAGVLQYGHGLFGTYHEVEYGSATYLYEDATEFGYVICASTWLGLSQQDIPALASITVRDATDFLYVPDRTTQGVVNALGLMMMLRGQFSQDPVMLAPSSGKSIINPEKTAYFGNSLGGIFGSVYMATTQDVKRGLLGVPGGSFGLLLPRSRDFSIEFDALKVRYSDPVDRINLMMVLQLLWDRSEPAGYMGSLSKDPLPNTPPHEVLIHYGLGDAQVTWLGAQAIGRSVDAVQYASNAKEYNESFYGLELISDDAVITGRSGVQGWDYSSPPVPLYNVPPVKEGDTHECTRRDDRAQSQMGRFFLQGEIANTCGGTCVAPNNDDC